MIIFNFLKQTYIGIGEREWVVSKDQYKYDDIFDGLNPIDGKITGAAAKQEMMKSKLPNNVLGTVYIRTISFLHLLFALLKWFKPQIREQMFLEIHFQYEYSILGNFGQSGLMRKKNPNHLKYATFEASFFMFSWTKNNLNFFLKIP